MVTLTLTVAEKFLLRDIENRNIIVMLGQIFVGAPGLLVPLSRSPISQMRLE